MNKSTKSTKQPKTLDVCHSFGWQLKIKDLIAKSTNGTQFIFNRADEENRGAMFEKWLKYLGKEYGFEVKSMTKYQKYLITITK